MNDPAVASRAKALAEISQMQTDLVSAYKDYGELQQRYNQANDRIELLSEERAYYRSQAILYRTKLTELATSISNIGLLTIQAQEVSKSIEELILSEGSLPENGIVQTLETADTLPKVNIIDGVERALESETV